jgi:hypothetical protein
MSGAEAGDHCELQHECYYSMKLLQHELQHEG